MITKPMLAGTVLDINTLKYPLFASPKIDGIRCLVLNGQAYTYSRLNEEFKVLKNVQMRSCLRELPNGLDGELVTMDNTGASNNFNDIQSKVMSKAVVSPFQYLIFDYLPNQSTRIPFFERCKELAKLDLPFFCSLLPQVRLDSSEQLEEYEAQTVARGYEGVMLRKIDAPYKQGRSTLNEAYLLKLKRWQDAECEVVGVEELVREHHEEFTGLLGALVCKYNDVLFNIGTGFTDLQRRTFWKARNNLPKIVTFKYQAQRTTKDAPISAVFKSFRLE